MSMRRWIVLGLAVLLAACASTPTALQPPAPPQLFHDALFAPPSQTMHAADVFALDDEMRRYLREVLVPRMRDGRQRALIEALYQHGALRLEYDAAVTRNAREAFAARAGNCLSLVILTAAFAKELDMPVTYNSAVIDETWSRSGNLYFANGHVNITLGRRIRQRMAYDAENLLTVDFLPPEELHGLRTREIDEATVVAMYMNNRAAEALVADRLDDAYWWSREALRQRSDFLPAYNTLGVVYMHRSQPAAAEHAFAHVLRQQPSHRQAMSNMVLALRQQHRDAEADALKLKLAALEPEPPFHFFNLGMAALKAGNFIAARKWFAREVDRASYNHEFHFWLAVAELQLGEVNEARKQLKLALDNSTTRSDRDLYAAKLDRLKASVRTQ
jgi:tetratricopeptide (TPR) repeat protein